MRAHWDDNWDKVHATVGGQITASVAGTSLRSDAHGDMNALVDLVQDEYGVREQTRTADGQYSFRDGDGAMFEIVAVPDDVAGSLGHEDGSGYAAEYDCW